MEGVAAPSSVLRGRPDPDAACVDNRGKSAGAIKVKDARIPMQARRRLGSDKEAVSRPQSSSIFSAAMKASCGISTLPNWRIRFLPAFCFSSSFFLRVASPP